MNMSSMLRLSLRASLLRVPTVALLPSSRFARVLGSIPALAPRADAQLLGMVLRTSDWKTNDASGALEKSYSFKDERTANTFSARREY